MSIPECLGIQNLFFDRKKNCNNLYDPEASKSEYSQINKSKKTNVWIMSLRHWALNDEFSIEFYMFVLIFFSQH